MGAIEQPGDRHLRDCGVVLFGKLVQHAAGFRQFPGSNRKPGDKRELVLLAILQCILMAAVGKVYMFCALTTGIVSACIFDSAGFTSESPMWRILPSCCIFPSSPN